MDGWVGCYNLQFYPLVATIACAFLSLLGLASSTPALRVALVGAGPFAALGGYFGWFYLRFLNRNADQSRGDVSDEFALVVLLPDAFACVSCLVRCLVWLSGRPEWLTELWALVVCVFLLLFFSPIVGPVANFAFSVVKLCGYLKNRSDKPTSLLPVVVAVRLLGCRSCSSVAKVSGLTTVVTLATGGDRRPNRRTPKVRHRQAASRSDGVS